MAFAGGSGGGVRSDINITPLVDVVLVLLIIFMVMTPSLLKETEVAIPEKADVTMAAPSTADQLVLSISPSGSLALNQEPITQSELLGRLHERLATRMDKVVFLEVDDEANYGDVVHVMDLCRGAGVKTLGLMQRP
jgi:biopolymer transport protein ExbD